MVVGTVWIEFLQILVAVVLWSVTLPRLPAINHVLLLTFVVGASFNCYEKYNYRVHPQETHELQERTPIVG